MNASSSIALLLVLTSSGAAIAADPHDDRHGAEEVEKGPHGGRLLQDGDFAVELTIFEAGVEPQFRAFVFRDGVSVDPVAVSVAVELVRLGGDVDRIAFTPRGEYLLGDAIVREPHSFVVTVKARYKDASHQWQYDSFEGRTSIAADSAAAAGIMAETAGSATVRETLILHGVVVPDPQRVHRLQARYPGVVKEVRKRLGESVTTGEVVLVIESNESLQRYNVVAPSAGVVVSRDVNPGMVANGQTLLTIADLSTVWVELAAFQHDIDRIQPAQPATIRDVDGHQTASGIVDSIAPVGSPASQSMTARIVVPNTDGRWRPGLFVTGEVTLAETVVAVGIRQSALQSFRDWTVAFVQVGDEYEIRPLTLGRNDGAWVEVLEGLDAGARYVTEGSYLIKADIEKSGAAHDH